MLRRWVTVGLIVSIAINLLCVGYLVGRHVIGTHFSGPSLLFSTTTPFTNILRPLGKERVEELIPNSVGERRALRQHFVEIRKAQRELEDATIAEPFVRDNLIKAQQKFNELFGDAKARHDRMWVNIAEQLTPEERQLIMRRAMPREHKDRLRRLAEHRREDMAREGKPERHPPPTAAREESELTEAD